MNEEENFLTIGALSSLIDQKVRRIQNGNLKIQMLEQLLDEVKELQERLIIIKYKAMVKLAKPPVEKNLFSDENFDTYVQHGQKPMINFDLSTQSDKPEIPKNQISLIDSIEELSKEEKKKKKKREKAEKKRLAKAQNTFSFLEKKDQSATEVKEEKIKVEIVSKEPPEKSNIQDPKIKKSKITESKKTTLSQKIRKTQIDNIPKAIKLNQRIGMIKKLFGGDADLFKTEIDKLNKASDLSEAQKHLENLKNNGDWQEKNEWFVLLSGLVERRHN